MRADPQLQARHPREPWLWRKDWCEKRVTHSHLRSGLSLLAFALAWNAVVVSLAFFAFRGEQPGALRWMLGIFLVLGVLLLYGGVRAAVIGVRQGTSKLELREVPQRLDRPLVAEVRARALPEGAIRATLGCEHRPTRGRPGIEVWREARDIPRASIQKMPDEWRVPLRFEFPPTAEESRNAGEANEIRWTLRLTAGDQAAPVYAAEFELPVFGGRREEDDEFERLLAELPEDVRQKIQRDLT